MAESNREEIAKLEALYANNPGGRVFTHLAEAYRKAGELDRARTILETGITRHSDYASAHVVLGRVLADQGALEAAAVEFRRVLELDPENRVALRSLGDIARNSDPARALEHYRHLRTLDPADDDLANTIASLETRVERDAAESPAEAEPPTHPTDEPAYGEIVEPEPWQPMAAEAKADRDEPAWGETPSALTDSPSPVSEPTVSEGFDLGIEPKTANFGDTWQDTADEDEGLPGDLAHLTQSAEPAAEPEPEPLADSDAMMSASSAFKELGEPTIEPMEVSAEPPTESAESFDQIELTEALPEPDEAPADQPVEEEFWEALPAAIVEEERADEPPSEGATSWDFPAEPDLVTSESTEEIGTLLEPVGARLTPAEALVDPAEALVDPGPGEVEESLTVVPDFMVDEAPEPLMHEPTFEQMLTANLGPESPLASGQADLPTETLAELYRTQGFFGRAADVYRSLLVHSPDDLRLRQRLREVEELEHSPMEASGERMFDELNAATPEDDELSARVAATSEQAGPPEAWLEDIEAAWTGGEGAADLADSPYAWSHDASDEDGAGTSLQEYLRTLLAWRPTEPFRQPEPEPEPVAETPEPAVAEFAEPAAPEVREPDVPQPAVPEQVTAAAAAPVELEPWEMPYEPPVAPAAAPAQPVPAAAVAPVVPPPPPAAPTPPPPAAPQRKASGNVVDDAFEEWFSGSSPTPAAAPTAPVDDWFAASASPSVAQPLAAPAPQPPPAAREAAPAPTVEDTAEDESDDDLEVFRSWLQSLKR